MRSPGVPIPRRDGCALPRGSNDTAGAVARSPGVPVLRQDGGALRRGSYPLMGRLCVPQGLGSLDGTAVCCAGFLSLDGTVVRYAGFLSVDGTAVRSAGVPITRRGGGALPRYFNSATVALTRSADYNELLQRSGTLS